MRSMPKKGTVPELVEHLLSEKGYQRQRDEEGKHYWVKDQDNPVY